MTITGTGTATALTTSTNSRFNRLQRMAYRQGTASTTAVSGFRDNSTRLSVGGQNSWEGGFWGVMHGGPDTGANIATHRFFMGLWDSSAPSDVNPSTLIRMVGIGYDSGDTEVQFMHNDGAGTATKIALGASFPKPNVASTFGYRLRLFSPPGTTQSVGYEVMNLQTGVEVSGTVTTDLPETTVLRTPHIYTSVGGTSSVVGTMVGPIVFQTED
jgi:hypothetical protein